MARKSQSYKFNVTVKLPTEENRGEYDLRVAKAVAKSLMEILPTKSIEKLIEVYKQKKKN